MMAGFAGSQPGQTETALVTGGHQALLQREQRSRSKAEKILGVSDYWNPQERASHGKTASKKRGATLAFSFSDLRDALTGTRKQHGVNQMPRSNLAFTSATNDSDSTSSTPSPTFDPTASTSTLPSTHSSPATPRLFQQMAASFGGDLTKAQDDPAAKVLHLRRAVGREMPAIAEHQLESRGKEVDGGCDLPPLDLPPLSPTSRDTKASLRFSLTRNKSTASIPSTVSDRTAKAKRLGRKNVPWIERYDPFEASPRQGVLKKSVGLRAGRNIQEWLDKADLHRCPSVAGHRVARPHEAFYTGKGRAFSSTSSSTSIRTLTSQSEFCDVPTSPGSISSHHWPLPANNFNFGDEDSLHRATDRRIFKNDLHLESVLSLSSDEESQDESGFRTAFSQSQSTLRSSETEIRAENARPRKDSIASTKSESASTASYSTAATNTTKPPSAFPRPGGHRRFPRRTLADIAAASTGHRRPSFSPTEWQDNDETELSLQILAAADVDLWANAMATSVPKPVAATSWETAKIPAVSDQGPSEEKESISTSPEIMSSTAGAHKRQQSLSSMRKKKVQLEHGRGGDIIDGELDVSHFPVPPRSRSNSAVPTIQIEMVNDVDKRESRPPVPDVPAGATVLLAPSMASRTSPTKSNCPALSSKSSPEKMSPQPQELQGSETEASSKEISLQEPLEAQKAEKRSALQRTRTISNVPIYVTGLERYEDGADADGTEGVAEFVFSNLY